MSDREFSDITAEVDALLADPKHAAEFASARASLVEGDANTKGIAGFRRSSRGGGAPDVHRCPNVCAVGDVG